MKLATGTVIDGKVVLLDGEPLREGAVVTLLAREEDETFDVPPELEAELSQSLAEAARGEFVSAEDVLSRLRKTR